MVDDQFDPRIEAGQEPWRTPARYWDGVSNTWDDYWPSNQQTCPVCGQAEHPPSQTFTCCYVHHAMEPITGWNFVCGECGHAYEDGSLIVCDACAHDL